MQQQSEELTKANDVGDTNKIYEVVLTLRGSAEKPPRNLLTDGAGALLKCANDVVKRWHDFLESKFSATDRELHQRPPMPTLPPTTGKDKLTEEEILKSLAKSKAGKAVGTDDDNDIRGHTHNEVRNVCGRNDVAVTHEITTTTNKTSSRQAAGVTGGDYAKGGANGRSGAAPRPATARHDGERHDANEDMLGAIEWARARAPDAWARPNTNSGEARGDMGSKNVNSPRVRTCVVATRVVDPCYRAGPRKQARGERVRLLTRARVAYAEAAGAAGQQQHMRHERQVYWADDAGSKLSTTKLSARLQHRPGLRHPR